MGEVIFPEERARYSRSSIKGPRPPPWIWGGSQAASQGQSFAACGPHAATWRLAPGERAGGRRPHAQGLWLPSGPGVGS